MSVERRARCLWSGDLSSGSGTLSTGSGALSDQTVTWASRAEASEGRTSPEELIAAAHATCFNMALSLVLKQRGFKAEQVVVDAVCSLELEGAPRISAVDVRVEGVVPGLDPDSFQSAVSAAADLCPVSNALRNNVRIGVAAELAELISTRDV